MTNQFWAIKISSDKVYSINLTIRMNALRLAKYVTEVVSVPGGHKTRITSDVVYTSTHAISTVKIIAHVYLDAL